MNEIEEYEFRRPSSKKYNSLAQWVHQYLEATTDPEHDAFDMFMIEVCWGGNQKLAALYSQFRAEIDEEIPPIRAIAQGKAVPYCRTRTTRAAKVY